MYVRMYVRMYVCMYVCLFVCLFTYLYVCICKHFFIYICICKKPKPCGVPSEDLEGSEAVPFDEARAQLLELLRRGGV